MKKESVETILKVGAAGGSITLSGIKLADGQWDFFIECNETAICDLMSDEDSNGFNSLSKSTHMHSIDDALLSLNC